MIFAAVSIHKYPFARFGEWLKRAIKEGHIKEEVIYQHGSSPAITDEPLIKSIIDMPYDQFMQNIKNSRLFISHGGMGCLTQSLSVDRVPIMIPRRNDGIEHIDDNQSLTCKLIANEFGIKSAYTYEEFIEMLKNPPKVPKLKSDKPRLVSYLDSLVKPILE